MNVLDQILEEQQKQRTLIDKVLHALLNPEPEDKHYTVQEFADKIGIHYQSVRNGLKDGRIKGKRFGRIIKIHSSEVENALTEFKSLKYQRTS